MARRGFSSTHTAERYDLGALVQREIALVRSVARG
jgi:hypothetical protein